MLFKAVQADIEQKYEEASKLYEEILSHPDASLETFINLACLYWQVTDYGFNATNNLPIEFVKKAGHRMYKVLSEAQERFDEVEELEFWRLYFNFTTLGDDNFLARATVLAKSNTSLVPYFHIYVQTQNEDYLPQVRQLITKIDSDLTTKNRYILSILDTKL